MNSTVKTYLKLALCVTLVLGVECRVIKIDEDVGDYDDLTVKIIIKHQKRDAHPKLRHKEHIPTEKGHPTNHNKMDTKTDPPNGHDDLDRFFADLDKNVMPMSSLPDNLFEDDSEQHGPGSTEESHHNPAMEPIPEFKPRIGIQVGSCPQGYIRRGMLCLPNNK
ncbi:unnamed protein product, partial [Iphiclides podalirius]